jgi:hypothetical protein
MKNQLTTEYFIERANKIHCNLYDYSESIYLSATTKLIIACSIHGNFLQAPGPHLAGQGCPQCGLIKRIKSQTKKLDVFIQQANEIHENKYDYSLVKYNDSKTSVTIICPLHGNFSQSPPDHLSGKGCLLCGIQKRAASQAKTQEEFIAEVTIIHGGKYDYSFTDYKCSTSKIIIICPSHGEFRQLASSHWFGRGCSKCVDRISKPETEWLNMLGIKEIYRQSYIKIGDKKLFVDAYDPLINTVYEFYGDFWHGNPKIFNHDKENFKTKTTFGELYNKTIERESLIKSAGYNLLFIWERDFKIIKKDLNDEFKRAC